MPPESPSRENESDASAARLGETLRVATGADAASELRFWRARADELAAQVDALRARLIALARCLPPHYAQLLARPPEEIEREPEWPDPLAGWKETTSLERSSVVTELPRLWSRLGHPTGR